MSTGRSLADQLKIHRAALGVTQAELAERAGISERAVSDMERGLRRVIYRETADRLVRALELRAEEATRFLAVARGHAPLQAQAAALPVPSSPMIGRSAQLAMVRELLLDPLTRVVTLTGPGGVGKTRLALEAGRSVMDEFTDGVVFVPLGELQDPDLLLAAITSALKTGGGSDPASALVSRLQGRRLLLILDTLEHLLKAIPALAEVLTASAPATLLATSRIPLNIRAERLVSVRPLAAPHAKTMFTGCVSSLLPGSAAQLNDAVVAEICRQLDGLPLAIELAAARTRMLAPAEIRDHLGRRLEFLTGGPVDLPERQRSMAATIGWSHALLASEDRLLLEQLTTFAGSWTVDSARQVCDISAGLLGGLSRLVDSSLVLADASSPETTRYRMLDTVREYAADRLTSRAGAHGIARLRQRHATYFCALAEQAEPNLRGSEHQTWVGRLSDERDNLRAALGWAIADNSVEIALRMAGALWWFWRLTGAFSEGRAWLRRVLELDATGYERRRARALWGAGWLAYQQGDFVETAGRGAELARWARSVEDAAGVRNAVTLLGEERLALEDYPGAADHFEEALTIARGSGSPWLLATSCLNRSVAAQHLGDLNRAEDLLAEAQALYRQLGDDRFTARVWLQLAYLALLRQNPKRAQELVIAGLSKVRALGDRWAIAEQLDGMAAVLAAEGDSRGAAFIAGAAESAWESIGATPQPTDRRSTDRWLIPVLEDAGPAGEADFAEGRVAGIDAALASALRDSPFELPRRTS